VTDLGHALKAAGEGRDHAATVLVAFGDVAARFAELASTLDIDFDEACLAYARGQGIGEPDAESDGPSDAA
jgi:hypothetical protein